MSGKGWVTTARGEGLNIDDLIAKSKRPIGVTEEKSTIKKPNAPSKRKPVNVRGFRPAHGEAQPRNATATAEETPARKAASSGGKTAVSQADLTGIKVKKRASTKKPTGTAEDASDALGDIITGLEDTAPKTAEKTTRRRTK